MNIEKQKYFKVSLQSYWLSSTSSTNYPSLQENIHVDVAIIGGGLAGISCAYLLKKENVNVAVLEAEHIAQNTSAHTTAKITSQHGLIYYKIKSQIGNELAQQYAEANEAAIYEIKKIIDENHIDCNYTTQSAFVYTQTDQYIQQINDELNTVSNLGIKASYVEDIPFPISDFVLIIKHNFIRVNIYLK